MDDEALPLKLKRAFGVLLIFFVCLLLGVKWHAKRRTRAAENSREAPVSVPSPLPTTEESIAYGRSMQDLEADKEACCNPDKEACCNPGIKMHHNEAAEEEGGVCSGECEGCRVKMQRSMGRIAHPVRNAWMCPTCKGERTVKQYGGDGPVDGVCVMVQEAGSQAGAEGCWAEGGGQDARDAQGRCSVGSTSARCSRDKRQQEQVAAEAVVHDEDGGVNRTGLLARVESLLPGQWGPWSSLVVTCSVIICMCRHRMLH